MKRLVLSAALLAVVSASPALASGEGCNVPKNEWQPQQALQEKLQAEGWQVKRIKVDDGCYEVYGLDAAGKRMETYFDPKTFVVVKSEQDD